MRTMILAAAIGATFVMALPGRAVLVVHGGLHEPFGVAFDAASAIYIVEMGGNRISVLDPNGQLRVLAGTGEPGLSGDGGPATLAQLNGPTGVATDAAGGILVVDASNRVRRIAYGTITTIAGSGVAGHVGEG